MIHVYVEIKKGVVLFIYSGVHAEGPFINKIKKGAHSEKYIQNEISMSLLQQCYGSLNRLKVITIAPELPGALEVIPDLVDLGVVVSIGILLTPS